jgi:23S rRNA G2069 N7-methylase RlmK/C1962 C5-methylase RlmI
VESYQRVVQLKGLVTPQKARLQAEILTNSLRKKFKHLAKKFRRQNIDCFRLYDWDSPDIRLVIDWYNGHIVVAEYERKQTGPEYLGFMASTAAEVLNVPKENIHLKRRRTKLEDKPRYGKIDSRGELIAVKERDLLFWVNLTDFLDTGLFSDHRDTRMLIRSLSPGKDFLNLFAYTGAFTCAVAKAGAKTTETVDRSQTYINWAKDNLVLNGLWGKQHSLIQADVFKYLVDAQKKAKKFDLVFVDPPSFFNDLNDNITFDINYDHRKLLKNVIKLIRSGGDLFFSTNHQRFEPQFNTLAIKAIKELTPKTIPEDYRNRNIHRCWQMKV